MIKKITLSILLFLWTWAYSQAQMILDWAHTFGEHSGSGTVVVASGYEVYALVAYAYGEAPDFDTGPGQSIPTETPGIAVLKIDASGNLLWARAISGQVDGLAMDADMDGNVYVTGRFQDTVDFDAGPGVHELYHPPFPGEKAMYILKLSASGNFMWVHKIASTSLVIGRGMEVLPNGDVYVTGQYRATTDFNPGPGVFELPGSTYSDIFIQKLDRDGNFLWAAQAGGNGVDISFDIASDSQGNTYTVGQFEHTADFDPGIGLAALTTAGMRDIFVLKLDPAGNYQWARRAGGPKSELAYGVCLDTDDNLYLTGTFLDTADFGYGGPVQTVTSIGGGDIFVSRLTTSGDPVWNLTFGPTTDNDAIGQSITAESVGNYVYLVGYFSDTMDVDPGPGVMPLVASSSADVVVAKISFMGDLVWALSYGSEAFDRGYSVCVSPTGHMVTTTGEFGGVADFDPGPGVYADTGNTYNSFIHRLRQADFGITETIPSASSVFPNPTQNLVRINWEGLKGTDISWRVFDGKGQPVKSQTVENCMGELEIDVTNLVAGIYYVEINTAGGKLVQKFIKQ